MTARERPILFNAPMVRAILDGRKTQTRRPVKPQPVMQDGWVGGAYWQPKKSPVHGFPERFCIRDIVAMCPLGQRGDRLWVREAWAHVPASAYRCSEGVQQTICPADPDMAAVYAAGWSRSRPGAWRPSIHMPRWASRITLEITDVRVQRVQHISEADAVADGVSRHGDGYGWHTEDGRHYFPTPEMSFASLWGSTYGPGSWDSNDWVWAVSFERVTP